MSRIIMALDLNDSAKALELAQRVRHDLEWVKVGLELFIKSGPPIIIGLKDMGFSVFLDLKLLDIPNTVSRAVSRCIEIGADMITLHTLGGEKMIKAAISARNLMDSKSRKTSLIGVTLLTSMDQSDIVWQDRRSAGEITADMAEKACKWGLDGCVCSGLEASVIRKTTGSDFKIITPGIRTQPSADDQKRVVTPQQARQAGSDFLVIGRPVTGSSDPVRALHEIKRLLA